MAERLRVALLFGGRSAEHDVSVMSAGNVFRALDPARYDTIPIGITRSGVWLLCSLKCGAFPVAVPESGPRVALIPGGAGRLAILSETDAAAPDLSRSVDVVFPVLHGPFGEDGTVQGAAEIAGVPYVGSGVLGSAAAMDKDVAKRLMRDSGLPIARFLSFAQGDDAIVRGGRRRTWPPGVRQAGAPWLVGRHQQGGGRERSSPKRSPRRSGMTAKSWSRNMFAAARSSVAFSKMRTVRSPPRRLARSCPATATASTPMRPNISTRRARRSRSRLTSLRDVSDKVRKLSIEAFRALGCEGLARVDFFLREDGSLVINEVNTLPGFTNISMYPKVMEALGISYSELVDRLIRHALARAGIATEKAEARMRA